MKYPTPKLTASIAKKLEKSFFHESFSTNQIIAASTSSDIIRSFHMGKCYSNFLPSSLCAHWLYHHVFQDKKVRKSLFEAKYFNLMHKKLKNNFTAFWQEKEPEANGVQFYHFAKVIDVALKYLSLWDEFSPERQKWFFNHANCPIDTYSLEALRRSNVNWKKRISFKSSMGYIGNDDKLYAEIQTDIRKAAGRYSAILFDLYAWEYVRPSMKQDTGDYNLIKVRPPK